jgi:hypothetical protein
MIVYRLKIWTLPSTDFYGIWFCSNLFLDVFYYNLFFLIMPRVGILSCGRAWYQGNVPARASFIAAMCSIEKKNVRAHRPIRPFTTTKTRRTLRPRFLRKTVWSSPTPPWISLSYVKTTRATALRPCAHRDDSIIATSVYSSASRSWVRP